MIKYTDINQVWAALDKNITVYWASEAYTITIENTDVEWRQRNGFEIPWSNRDGKCLRVTCTENYFGSLLDPKELNGLFSKQQKG